MTTDAEIQAAVKAIEDLRLMNRSGSSWLDPHITRVIALAVLHAAEEVRNLGGPALSGDPNDHRV